MDEEQKRERNHKEYYFGSGGLEVFSIIDQFGLDFYLGNVIKYVCRAGKKDRNTKLEDLRKAEHYILEAINRLK